LMDFTDLHFTR